MKYRTQLLFAIAYSIVCFVFGLGIAIGIALFAYLGIYWLAAFGVGILVQCLLPLFLIWRQVGRVRSK